MRAGNKKYNITTLDEDYARRHYFDVFAIVSREMEDETRPGENFIFYEDDQRVLLVLWVVSITIVDQPALTLS